MTKLAQYNGRDVLSTGVEVRNASGGLNDSLAIEPREWEHDEEVTVVMRCVVDKVRHDKVPKTDGLRLVGILTAKTAMVIDDPGALDEQLRDHQREIDKRKLEAKGVHELPLTPEGLHEHHFDNGHDEPVEGCPDCAELAGEPATAQGKAADG